MKRSAIRLTLIFGVITIIGVSIVQVFFLKQALDQEDKRLDQTIQIALSSVSDHLARYNNADLPNENPVVKIRPDYYVVNVNNFIDSEILEHYLYSEFNKRKLWLNFEYGIYDCLTDEIVYGNYISLNNNSRRDSALPNFTKHQDYLYYFGIVFPDRNKVLLSNLGLWYFFTGILLLVIIFFAITQVIILRQRRYSEIQKDFINNLTHEFKTPLSSISMAADVLLEDDQSNDLKRFRGYGRIIKDQAIHLVGQVDRVLHDSNKGLKSFIPRKSDIDLKKLVNVVVDQFKPLVSKKDGKIILDFCSEDVIVKADPQQIHQAIFNILDNSLKFSPSEPFISLELRRVRNGCLLSISDRGVGIPQKHQNKIFKKFFRVPQGNVHNVKGFGLGLHFVYRVIKAHRWRIFLESEENRGTKISILIKNK